jgi:hypothetical protein
VSPFRSLPLSFLRLQFFFQKKNKTPPSFLFKILVVYVQFECVARNKSPKGGGQEEAAEKKTKWNVRFYFSKNNFSDDAHFEI